MKILTITAIIALPLLALGQTNEPQQSQEQTKETQTTTAPTKTKKMHSTMEQNKPEIRSERGTSVRGETNVKGHGADMNRHETGVRSGTSTGTGTSETNVGTTSQTNVGSTSQTTTVNKQEFRSRHSDVFSLGRHPKDFFIQRYGENHFRLIGNTYFVFVDGCWVAVDVDGFVYTQRMICQGDPDFIAVD